MQNHAKNGIETAFHAKLCNYSSWAFYSQNGEFGIFNWFSAQENGVSFYVKGVYRILKTMWLPVAYFKWLLLVATFLKTYSLRSLSNQLCC